MGELVRYMLVEMAGTNLISKGNTVAISREKGVFHPNMSSKLKGMLLCLRPPINICNSSRLFPDVIWIMAFQPNISKVKIAYSTC